MTDTVGTSRAGGADLPGQQKEGAVRRGVRLSLVAFIVGGLFAGGGEVEAQEGYRRPSQDIIDILEAPGLPDLIASPTGEWGLFVERPEMVTLEEIAEPRLHLAGYRLNPRTNGPSAAGRPNADGMEFVHFAEDRRVRVAVPSGWTMAHHRWAPDGSGVLFSRVADDGYELWFVGTGQTEPRRIGAGQLNAAQGMPCTFTRADEVLCRFVSSARGAPPPRPSVPESPRIQESTAGEPAPARTFQDLLQDEHDSQLFEHYFTSQLTFVDLTSGVETPVGAPAIIDRFDPSPDGAFLYVVRTVRPFSYVVPDRWRTNDWFPREMEIWDRSGRMVRTVASLPLEEEVAVDDFRSGPRSVMWQPGSGAALLWVEDVTGEVAGVNDRVMRLPEPHGTPVPVLDLADRFAEMAWTAGGSGLITEVDRFPRRAASWMRSWLIDLERGGEPRLVVDRSTEVRFGAPGNPVTTGGSVLLTDGDWIFLQGDGVTREGERPFLDRFNLVSLETERLWESDPSRYEVPVALLGGGVDRLLVRSESSSDHPNFHYVDRGAGVSRALTALTDPAPLLRQAQRHVLTYEREDGVRHAGVLYTPPGWDGSTRLPMVLWAYPREFVSPEAAAQVPGESNRFTRISGASHMFFLLKGYAVFDGPSIAILGGRTANDTYIEQLVSSTAAAVDAAVEAGIVDRDRVGVGGHSYGGFMTANLLAHSRIFKAGIARSAAHNRSLTPFGFQNEQRTFWEATDVYTRMSPFMFAHQIEDAILIMHGSDDANPGTFPVQSERMFHALKGMGKTARLVMLTHEDHGYGARESIYHSLAEMIDWFELHVKGR